MVEQISPELPLMTTDPAENHSSTESAEQCCFVQWIGRVWSWIKTCILEPIAFLFQTLFSCCCLPAIPLSIDDSIRPRILEAPDELLPALDTIASKTLINLWCTCYLNATLQMIARLNSFNDMLSRPLEEPVHEQFDTEQEFLGAMTKCQNRQLLQNHLAAIVHKMRSPDKDDLVSEDNLKVLFHLLQVCGWRKQAWQQQDPHELLMFLRTALNAEDNSLKVASTINDTATTRICSEETHAEIAIELPVNDKLKAINHCETMTDLVNNFLQEEEIADYIPTNQKGLYVTATKKQHFLAPAPKTLFIQEKRFGWNNHGAYRIPTALPTQALLDSQLEIPFFNLEGTGDDKRLVDAEIRRYRLKTIICHHGGMSSESGHYTAIAAQQHEGKTIWMHYNDAQKPKGYRNTHNTSSIPQTISSKIKTDAYYLAYELIDAPDET